MRIALVTPMLPSARDLTRGRYILETAAGLSRLAQVRVFHQTNRFPVPNRLASKHLVAAEKDDTLRGLDVEAFVYPSIPFATRLLNGFTGSRFLTPRVRAFAPDMILAYWVYPDGFAAVRSARYLQVPCVVGALGSDIHVRSGLVSLLTARTIREADALLTVSDAMREAAIRDFRADPTRVHTVINGFNTNVFYPRCRLAARRGLDLAESDRLIIYVGRFVEAKGLAELIEAFKMLSHRDARYRLALVGDGAMRAQLSGMIARAGLGTKVILTGGLPPAAVAEWIGAADVLTLPSWSEGYPNVVVEAIACGRPVVATDVGGTREIVNQTNGIMIPPRNADALCSALESAIQREWDHAAIAEAMKRTWDDVAAETLAICEAVLKCSSSGKPTFK